MTIAIVGGTGFLGSAIARALVARGADVLQIARGDPARRPVEGARFEAADRTDEEALGRLFSEHGVTDAIDVMTLTLETARTLLSAAGAAGARYVMISAIDVTANYGGLARLETPPVLPRPTREDDPRRATPYPYRHLKARPAGIDPVLLRDYDKIPIEDAAQADPSLRALILRLPAIYGPGDPQGRFVWLTDALARGDAELRIDARAAAWPQSFVYIDDAGDAVARAALSDLPGQVLHVATPRVRTMGQWAEALVRAGGLGTPVVPVPPGRRGLMAERADLMDMRYPLTLDGSRFADLLGPVEVTPEADALAATLAAARS